MVPLQALETLGLTPSATPEQIRQAYRDLVKVWHPDRFGADARLRAKAEEKLKSINAAFNLLEGCDFRFEQPSSPHAAPEPEFSGASPSRSSQERVPRRWLYAGSLLLIAALAGFAIHAVRANQGSTSTPVTQASPATSEIHAKPPHRILSRQAQTPAVAAPGTPDFKIWSLSRADTDRLQLACASHAPGTEAYRECVSAQLDAITQRPGGPDMTGLSSGERDAAESACHTARAVGDAAYSRCLRQQTAELAAEPIRPDLSSFSAADRESIRTACSAASRRGAAEYDRCLVRFARTLSAAETSPPTP